MEKYNEFTSRNSGYIPQDLQQKLRKTRLLIAGCGIGSTLAEGAARMGFEKFILVDNDSIEITNLNRQAFDHSDIGRSKVKALAQKLRGINPQVEMTEINDWVSYENAAGIVSQADLVFDTIDFMSLHGIVALHDECFSQKKPVVSCLSAGWGAAAICFLQKDLWTFRKVFEIPEGELPKEASYVHHFMKAFQKIAENLSPEVVKAMSQVFHLMEDGRPCPASQISPGASSVASIGLMAACKILAGEQVPTAPNMMLIDPFTHFKTFSLNNN